MFARIPPTHFIIGLHAGPDARILPYTSTPTLMYSQNEIG